MFCGQSQRLPAEQTHPIRLKSLACLYALFHILKRILKPCVWIVLHQPTGHPLMGTSLVPISDAAIITVKKNPWGFLTMIMTVLIKTFFSPLPTKVQIFRNIELSFSISLREECRDLLLLVLSCRKASVLFHLNGETFDVPAVR